MDDDDVSWGSGEFSDGESDNEILEESGKEVQSVQVGSLEHFCKQGGGDQSISEAMDDDGVSWAAESSVMERVTMRY